MSDEIELISDGEGLAVIGSTTAVDRFLSSAGVPSRDLQLGERLGTAFATGAGLAQAGSQIAASSGRWVKLTEESAKALKLGEGMKGSVGDVIRAIATRDGKITKILEFAKPGSIGSMLTNPAMLAGAAGIMAQLAMQQTMEEITDYLKTIDEKVDDILRAQKDAAIAEMIGVGMVIDDAMLKREHVGHVSEVTWSSLHGAAQTIATTQAYALRQLDALVDKLEKDSRVDKLDEVTSAAEMAVEEWLSVLARSFQLQDGLAVLELDRVFASSPDDLVQHRLAVQAARRRRQELISATTTVLLSRMNVAIVGANEQVLLHPFKAHRIVRSGNEVVEDVTDFHERLSIATSSDAVEAKSWPRAVGDARDDVLEFGERGVKAASEFGAATFENTKTSVERFVKSVGVKLPWNRSDDQLPGTLGDMEAQIVDPESDRD